jgi:hypothetical protein
MSIFTRKKNFKLSAAIEKAMEHNVVRGCANLYAPKLISEIRKILINHKHTILSSAWNNCEGETICVSWIESGELFSEMFDVVFVIEEDKEND